MFQLYLCVLLAFKQMNSVTRIAFAEMLMTCLCFGACSLESINICSYGSDGAYAVHVRITIRSAASKRNNRQKLRCYFFFQFILLLLLIVAQKREKNWKGVESKNKNTRRERTKWSLSLIRKAMPMRACETRIYIYISFTNLCKPNLTRLSHVRLCVSFTNETNSTSCHPFRQHRENLMYFLSVCLSCTL